MLIHNKSFELGRKDKEKEILKIIEEEIVYPDYQEFKSPAEAITQFKINLKERIEEYGRK